VSRSGSETAVQRWGSAVTHPKDLSTARGIGLRDVVDPTLPGGRAGSWRTGDPRHAGPSGARTAANPDAGPCHVLQHGGVLETWGLTLTDDIARQIRRWRVEEGHTWRMIAERADDTWGIDTQGNQMAGEDLWLPANGSTRRRRGAPPGR
jgi:hypothetical protein